MSFKPTFLYVKQHKITGLLYFGKTFKNPEAYSGSGKYWLSHIKKHGNRDILTLWYKLYMSKDEIVRDALMYSELWKITESPNWANLKNENGLDGGRASGWHHSEETKLKLSLMKTGKSNPKINKVSAEGRDRIAASQRGKKLSELHREKISKGHKGKKLSPEHCAKMSVIAKNRSFITETRRLTTLAIKNGKASALCAIKKSTCST